MTRIRHWWVAALVLFLATPLLHAQLQTGNIYGKVQAKDGSVLPGVTVTLAGVGAPQTFVTDTTGSFRFLNLSPGTYSLKADLAGFGTATRNGVGVNIGRNADVTMTLNPAAAESITVTAEAPLLDVRKTGTGADITRVELEQVPTGRDPWVILQQTPGVLMDRINVGGNESGQQSSYVGKGSGSAQATWNVDGVNITDVGALGSSPAYYDFDSFEEMQVTTGGADPRVQTPGVQLNMVTKRGTNDVRGSARFFNTRNSWQAPPQIPAEAQSYLKVANEIDKIDDYGAEIGGPVIKDRLWLWAAYARQQINLLQASSGVLLNDSTKLENKNLKLNAQLMPSNSFAFAGMVSGKTKFGRNVGPTRPAETGWNQDNNYNGPTMWKVEDTQIFGPNLYLTGLVSRVQGGFQLISDNGQRCTSIDCGLAGAPTVFDLSDSGDGLPHNSYLNVYTERPQSQYRADGSTFFNTGTLSNELKFGFGYRKATVRSLSAWPGDQILFFSDPPGKGATGGVQLNKHSDFRYEVGSTDIYAGDTIMAGNLTIQAGLRYDGQKGTLLAGTIPANAALPSLLPSITYGGGDSVKWSNVAPRLGLTYSLGADKKTLLRAAANRYVDQLGGYTMYGTSPLGYGYIYMGFTDKNGNNRVDPGEVDQTGGPFGNGILGWLGNIDPSKTTAVNSVRRWDNNLHAPTTDEFILGAEHELLSDLTFGLTGTYRKFHDLITLDPEKHKGQGDFYTSADYEFVRTITGTLPNGGPSYSIPFYDLKSGVDSPIYYVFRNRPDYSQEYKGLELTMTKRMAHRWMLRGSLTLQDWTQSVGAGAWRNPTHLRDASGNCNNCDGSIVVQGSGTGSGAKGGVYINSKWAYNLTGIYQIPVIETSLGFNVTGRQGYAIPYAIRVASAEGNEQVLAEGVSDPARLPNLMNVDLRLAKDIRFGRTGLTLSVDAFNVLNAHTVLQRNVDAYHGSWTTKENQITELQSPRVFRLGARLNF